MTAALRYEFNNAELEFLESNTTTPDGVIPNFRVEDVESDSNALLPRFAVEYKLTPNVLTYASITAGYRPAGVNFGADNDSEEVLSFDRERSLNYEVGLKSSWFDNRLTFNAAVFQNNIDDFQVVLFNQFLQAERIDNADASITGAEFELKATPAKGFDILAGFGFVDTDFTKRIQVDLSLKGKAADLLAQQNLTRVTGIEVNQTNKGLELILKTAAGGERLVPLILPEGNNLVIDILDATLGFSIRNGVSKTSPAPGIEQVQLTKVDESSIRLTITGANQTPSAEIVPSRQNLVLNVTPEQSTAQQEDEPTEEINIVVTEVGTRTATDPQDIPQTIQVIPQDVIENRETNNFTEALRGIPGIVPANGTRSIYNEVLIRGFFADYRRNGLRDGITALAGGQTANVERFEVLQGPASVLYGQGSFGGTINVVTKKPTDEPFYKIDAAIGNFNLYHGAIDLSGPLNESKTVKYRLNLAAESEDSFIDFFERERFQVAPVLSWQIGKNTDITFEAEYSKVNSSQDIGIPASGTILDNPNGEIPLDRFIPDPDRDRDDL